MRPESTSDRTRGAAVAAAIGLVVILILGILPL
jgi:hypothetical protein